MTEPPGRPGLTRRALARSLAALPLTLLGCASDDSGQAGRPYHHTANGFRNPPGSPERSNPSAMPIWLLAGPGRNWHSATRSA